MGTWFSLNSMAENSNRTNSDYSSEYSEHELEDDFIYSDIYHRLTSHQTNEEYYGPKAPNIKHKPDTSNLDNSDFKFLTSQSAGILKHKKALKQPSQVASFVSQRERGLRSAEGFNVCNRSRISNKYLPSEMERLDRYEGKAYCGIFSKDGKYFITAAQDHAIRLYNTENGRYDHFNTISGRSVEWSIIDLAISPNNQDFVYSSWSSALHICPINGDSDKHLPLTLVNRCRKFCVFSIAFSSDGNEILCGANDGYMYVYSRSRNQRILKIPAHEIDVNSVAFLDDSSHIICSGGDDGLVKVWDRRMLNECATNDTWQGSHYNLDNPPPVGVLAGHKDGITYVHARGDGRHLISNSKDQSIKLWDLRNFSTKHGVKNTLEAVHGQRWDYRWQGVPKKLTTQTNDLDGDASLMTYRGHGVIRTLIRCKFSPAELTGQRYIYTGCGYGRLFIYDALTGKVKKKLTRHSNCVRDVSWHPYRNEIISSSWDGSIGRWYYSDHRASHVE